MTTKKQRYSVSPDGTNGYMQWYVTRDDGGGRGTNAGLPFDLVFDEETGGEEMAAKVVALLNAETSR